MLLDKKVKIIATIGPASQSLDTLEKLAEEGVDVYRINLSHASISETKSIISKIRQVENKIKRPLTVMCDLPGPKIRIGKMDKNSQLVQGSEVLIHKKNIRGNSTQFSLNHPQIIEQLKEGTLIYIDDGNIQLQVIDKNKEFATARVLIGGLLKGAKGFSAEGLSLHLTDVLKQDKESILQLLSEDVDAFAISFVQNKKDVLNIKALLENRNEIKLIAKIETENGVLNASEILEVADGLMIARGDLGLAIPLAKVPIIQKQLIKLCNLNSKPVITATQMLESMTIRPLPTRAEVTDVTNAILDGTDALMLSAETADGKYPVEVTKTMVKIILETIKIQNHTNEYETATVSNAISNSAGNIADLVNAKLIVAFTQSGNTARNISKYKHKQPIIALSTEKSTIKYLNFSWGVYPYKILLTKGFQDMREQAQKISRTNDYILLQNNDNYVIVSGMPFGKSGSTNMIFVDKVSS